MNCEFCDGKTVKKKVKRQHWLDGRLYIVENVEAEVCSDCGERYFHAKIQLMPAEIFRLMTSLLFLLHPEHNYSEMLLYLEGLTALYILH